VGAARGLDPEAHSSRRQVTGAFARGKGGRAGEARPVAGSEGDRAVDVMSIMSRKATERH
jgi:hypothetical protein